MSNTQQRVTDVGKAPREASRYFFMRDGTVRDSDDNDKIVARFDNWYDARGVCESMNIAYADQLRKFAESLPR